LYLEVTVQEKLRSGCAGPFVFIAGGVRGQEADLISRLTGVGLLSKKLARGNISLGHYHAVPPPPKMSTGLAKTHTIHVDHLNYQ
jgi:hypothetical protein